MRDRWRRDLEGERPFVARTTAILLLVGALVLAPTTVLAFDSFPSGAPHDRITRAAAGELGWSERPTHALVDAVRASDWKETAWKPRFFPPSRWLRLAPNAAYDPAHHFDRAPSATHAQAFQNGVRFVHATRNGAIAAATRGEFERAICELGAGAHALQDLMSHSNVIDLSPADRSIVVEAVLGSKDVVVPDALRITGYDPDAPDPERPPGDPYSHREFSKDNRHKNREARSLGSTGDTKFAAAVAAATDLTVRWMESIRASIAQDTWRELGGIGP